MRKNLLAKKLAVRCAECSPKRLPFYNLSIHVAPNSTGEQLSRGRFFDFTLVFEAVWKTVEMRRVVLLLKNYTVSWAYSRVFGHMLSCLSEFGVSEFEKCTKKHCRAWNSLAFRCLEDLSNLWLNIMTMTLRSIVQTYNLSEHDAIASNTHPTLTSMLEGRFQQCPKRCKLCKRQRGMFLTSVWMQRAMLKCSSSRCALRGVLQIFADV